MIDFKKINVFYVLIITTFLLGSSFTCTKYLLQQGYTPVLLAAQRFVFGALGIGVYLVVSGIGCARLSIKQFFLAGTIGLFQVALSIMFLFLCMQYLSASMGSILLFTNPFWMLIFGYLFLSDRWSIYKTSAFSLGVVGIIILLERFAFQKEVPAIGFIFGLLSGLCWAIATLINKKYNKDIAPLQLSFYQMLFGGIILWIISIVIQEPQNSILPSNKGLDLFYFLWLTIMSSSIPYTLWVYALSVGDPHKSSSYLLLVPVFASIISAILLREQFVWQQIVGGLCICLSIFFSSKHRVAKA